MLGSNPGVKVIPFFIFRSQEGVYTCEAYNSHGMATLHLTLEVVYPPSCTLTKEVTYTVKIFNLFYSVSRTEIYRQFYEQSPQTVLLFPLVFLQ
jgi:hypothetical protein